MCWLCGKEELKFYPCKSHFVLEVGGPLALTGQGQIVQ